MFNIASEETYQDGQIIIKEGSSGDWVYIIRSGSVEISKTIGGKKFVIEILQPGEVFGELGFLGGVKRTATARAVGETAVGILDREFLDQEFNKLYSDFRAILTAVVERFKKMIDRSSGFSSREQTRILETYSLKYKDKKSFVDAYSGDLSGGGIFIKTGNPLERGEQFSLKLQLPGIPNSVETKCEVVWTRKKHEETDTAPAGMGVRFIEMTRKNHQTLTQFLKNVLGTSPK